MINKQFEAFSLAKQAAQLDFSSAIQGLLAGHAEELRELRAELSRKDRAFLMALALTEKGVRLDKDGAMIKAIADGLQGKPLCEIERRFLKKAAP